LSAGGTGAQAASAAVIIATIHSGRLKRSTARTNEYLDMDRSAVDEPGIVAAARDAGNSAHSRASVF
jgi:hypothetical protein